MPVLGVGWVPPAGLAVGEIFMKWLFLTCFVTIACCLVSCNVRAESAGQTGDTGSAARTGSMMTPEMWFYLQERQRYEDSQQAIRRRSEKRAARREQRIAARKWYGHSNSRPQVSALPRPKLYSRPWFEHPSNRVHWSVLPTGTVDGWWRELSQR